MNISDLRIIKDRAKVGGGVEGVQEERELLSSLDFTNIAERYRRKA
jgi:hypothetical protein